MGGVTATADLRPGGGELRRTSAAVLNGDVVDYSRMIAEDVDGTAAVLELARSITAEAVTAAGGELADFIGDSFMAVFSTAPAAWRAARTITERLEKHDSECRGLRFRMGISLGELATDGARVYGDAVNIAARIREIVPPGGIAVSGDAFIRLDTPDEAFMSLGPQRLKGIPGTVRVYQAVSGDGAAVSQRRPVETRRPCLAFSGFLATDGSVESIARVMTKEVRTRLVRLPGLGLVRQPSQAMSAGGDPPARHILEASVDRLGDEVRVYLELIEVVQWRPVWGERYELGEDDLGRFVDSIASDIVAAIEMHLVVGEYGEVYRSVLSPASVDRIYEAVNETVMGTPESMERACNLLDRVADDDPEASEGPALGGFVTMLRLLSGNSPDAAADLERARSLSLEGRRRGDATALADVVYAQVLLAGGSVDEAAEAAERAFMQRKTCDATYAVKASVLRYLGRWEEAVDLVQQAIRMTPWPLPWYVTVLASALYVGERYQDVVDLLYGMAADDVVDVEALLLLAASQAAVGMVRTARGTADIVRMRHPSADVEELVRSHPFTDPAMGDRWLGHLAVAGLV